MKTSKFFLMGTLVLALGVVLAGCGNPIQVEGTVNIEEKKLNPPANVRVVKTTDTTNIIVSWDAAENARGYTLYAQQQGKRTIIDVSQWTITAQCADIYADADGTNTTNTDINKWSAKIATNPASLTATTGTPKPVVGQNYRFGISSKPLENSTNYASDIAWTNYIQY
jgi:hypothetical protein